MKLKLTILERVFTGPESSEDTGQGVGKMATDIDIDILMMTSWDILSNHFIICIKVNT